MYTERQLFGGAISCEVRSSWRDVSDIRQVPDHQEVWQQDSTGTSTTDGAGVLVVEILQRQEVDDPNAALFFFHDLAESNDISQVSGSSSFRTANPSLRTQIEGATACAGIGYQRIAMGNDHDINGQRRENQEIQWTCVELCVLRLARVETDLIVTITKPAANPNEARIEATTSCSSSLDWSEPFQRAISSMKIRDWQLFG